jgi:hypothetical protein
MGCTLSAPTLTVILHDGEGDEEFENDPFAIARDA